MGGSERGHTGIGDDRFGHDVLLGASGGCAIGGDEGEKTKRAGRLRHLPAGDARGACQGVPSVFAHVSRPHCFRLPGWKKRAGLLGSAGPLDAPGAGETAAGTIEPSAPTLSVGFSASAPAAPPATGSRRGPSFPLSSSFFTILYSFSSPLPSSPLPYFT